MSKPVLVFGGGTEERLVTVLCARYVMEAFPFEGIYYVAPDGRVSRVSKPEIQAFDLATARDFVPVELPFAASIAEAAALLEEPAFFLCIHGTYGLDAEIRQTLADLRVPFTGPTGEVTLRCGDKVRTKQILAANGVKVSPDLLLPRNPAPGFEVALAGFLAQHGKIVLKPSNSGSSIGLHLIADQASLERVIWETTVFQDFPMMAEKYVSGRELTVGVVDTETRAEALPPTEIVLEKAGVFDFDTKYCGSGARKLFHPELPESVLRKAQETAVLAHRKLGCHGSSRTDLIYSGGELYFLETNGTPGLTATSFVPKQLAVAGVELPRFVESQLRLAEIRARLARASRAG